ncbi:OmpA family protein [Larkinella punicea]|uniref:OmpA family protein n=1 Tax=Larkinella punicea TaxID=2315727 RepID=UPI001403A631|nr:OmpA family protein [Larkinella punicea]
MEQKSAQKTDEALDVILGDGPKKQVPTPKPAANPEAGSRGSASQKPSAVARPVETDPQETRNPLVKPSEQDSALNYIGTVLFTDHFSKTPKGDYPGTFVSSSGGEVVALNPGSGLWLYPNSNTVPQLKPLPEHVALEFDLTLQNVPASLYNTYFNVYFQTLSGLKHNDPKNQYGAFGFSLWGDAREHQLDLFNRNTSLGVKEKIPYAIADQVIGKTTHWVALVNKSRLRLFINGTKVADSPNLLSGIQPTSINFRLNGTKKEQNQRFILSNVKIVAIEKDLRIQLMEEGRFITSNILFATGSDRIEAESFELLDKIGRVLAGNTASRFSIVGHTDSDGDVAANQKLSEQRALSVRNYLAKQFNIPENRLEIIGKGENEPIADNGTAEGRRQNRRVEFRKL